MQKLYYSISEVSDMIDEEQHILRYWEKEFEQLNPKKNRAGNRIYSEKDISILKIIKNLLREEKLSLKGAKENLNRININNMDDHLLSKADGNGYFNEHFYREIPDDSLIIKRSELENIHTLLKEMKIFLIKM